MLKERTIPRQVKVTIYNTILRSILAYGSECWALTTKMRSKIQAAEMKVLRTIRGVTKIDKLRNKRIRSDLNVIPLLDFIEKGRLRWYGHIMRMDEGRIPRRYLWWRPQGKRPVGRPSSR